MKKIIELKSISKSFDGEPVLDSISLSKRSSLSWAFSNRYGRMGKGEECWTAGKWIESRSSLWS